MGTVPNEVTGQASDVGSEVHTVFGQNLEDEITVMLLKSYVLSALQNIPVISSVNAIDIIDITHGAIKIRLDVTIAPDNVQIQTDIVLGS